jgi:hypothetical protein
MKHLLLLALAATALVASDATGTWTGTMTVASGDTYPARMVLKQDGDKLTGTAGPDENEQRPIKNAQVAQGVVTFEVPTDNSVMKFALKQNEDEMSGEVTREQEGRTETARISVKRVK